MNTLYILIPLLLFKMTKPFQDTNVLSLQAYYILIDFALIIGLVTDDS
jgi:hypothetical protein